MRTASVGQHYVQSPFVSGPSVIRVELGLLGWEYAFFLKLFCSAFFFTWDFVIMFESTSYIIKCSLFFNRYRTEMYKYFATVTRGCVGNQELFILVLSLCTFLMSYLTSGVQRRNFGTPSKSGIASESNIETPSKTSLQRGPVCSYVKNIKYTVKAPAVFATDVCIQTCQQQQTPIC